MKENPKAEMQKIAKKMAVCFNDVFTTNKELVSWHIQANFLIFKYKENSNDKSSESSSFLSSFDFYLLPSLLEAKSNSERKSAIEEGLPKLFESSGYKSLKKALSEIGTAYLLDYSKLTSHAEMIHEFMNQLGCFMTLSEMYSDYEYLKREEYEERKQKAA